MLDSFVYSQLDKRQNEQNVQNDRILFFMRQPFVLMFFCRKISILLYNFFACSAVAIFHDVDAWGWFAQ